MKGRNKKRSICSVFFSVCVCLRVLRCASFCVSRGMLNRVIESDGKRLLRPAVKETNKKKKELRVVFFSVCV